MKILGLKKKMLFSVYHSQGKILFGELTEQPNLAHVRHEHILLIFLQGPLV